MLNVYFWEDYVYNVYFGGVLEDFRVFGISFLLLGGVLGLCGSGGPKEVFENI